MLSESSKNTIREAFEDGELETKSINSDGELEWKKVSRVARTQVPRETAFKVETSEGASVLTGGHRIYINPLERIETHRFSGGDYALGLLDNSVARREINSVSETEPRTHYFDIKVEDNHNFILQNTQLCVSNSPDRNYHFRPPTSEEVINNQNEVFAYLWEDHELVEYLRRAVDRINMHPPETNYNGVRGVVNQKPSWRTFMLTGAIVHATFALSMNWTADEFSYDIGGISLDIDKASMYESRMNSAEERFNKMLEAKERTVKITRGLKQSRYGIGVRSAFGPYTHDGAMTPQKFMGF